MAPLELVMRSVDTGLETVERNASRAFVEGMVGASTLAGPFARVEAGAKLLPRLNAFGFGQWTPSESSTGAGVRWTF